ncbi:MAG: phosphatase PAP2 family protein, partial [Myxococcaceae bacterium]
FAAYVLWATAIALSTLTTKPHYLGDVVTGRCLAVVLAAVFFWIPELRGGQRRGWATASSAR